MVEDALDRRTVRARREPSRATSVAEAIERLIFAPASHLPATLDTMEPRRASYRLVVTAVLLAASMLRCSVLVDSSDLSSGEQGTSETGTVGGDASEAASLDTTLDAGDLPDGAVVWPENGHAYLVVARGRSILWEAAKEEAAAMGGHLATISSAAENQFVFDLARANDAAWNGIWGGPYLGGFQSSGRRGADWAWVTGEPWSYTAWAPSEPTDDSSEKYLQLNERTRPLWNNINTGSANSFVVEFE